MNKFISLAILSVFLVGCSPSASETTTNGNAATNKVAMINANTAVSTNMEDSVNLNKIPPANNGNLEVSSNPLKKLGREKTAKQKVDPTAETFLGAAPDNSVISTAANEEGKPIEIRTFKDNPQLVKVVRIYTSADNPTIKVYLKNGKVADLPKGKIENILSASAKEILSAVGNSAQTDASSVQNAEKKRGKQ